MSTIITFYSYKGGVGRTMALANVAVILARQGKRVLAVDWDLEAPGLERYFGYFEVKPSKGGLLPLLQQHRGGSRGHYRPHLARVSARSGQKPFELDLLPSGRDIDPNYSATLERFDWERYFEQEGGGDFIESLRTKWREEYDVVLIDSRTGLSDTGGICTIQLPDTVVAMFSPNHQSLWGVRQTMELAQTARDRLAYDRMHLRVLPVPSRFSLQESPEAADWVVRIGRDLNLFYQDWVPTWAAVNEVVKGLRIPQIDRYGFGEKLAVVEEEDGTGDPMAAAYHRIAELIVGDSPDAELVLGLTRPAPPTRPKQKPKKKTAAAEGYQYDVYISHASGSVLDGWVDTFTARLREQSHLQLGRPATVFLDLSEIRTGDDWSASIRQALHRSRVLVAFVTPEYVASEWCRAEWAHFELRESKTNQRPLILPFLLRRPGNLPTWVADRQWLDLTDLPTTLLSTDPIVAQRVAQATAHLETALQHAPPFDPHWEVRGPAELTGPILAAGAAPQPVSSGLELEADAVVALLDRDASNAALEAARKLSKALLDAGDYSALVKVAGAMYQRAPDDRETSLSYARGLLGIEDYTGAETLLTTLARQLPKSDAAYPEVVGQLGRACKRIFVRERSKTSARAGRYLTKAMGWYRKGYEVAPKKNTWHGVNLVALLAAARRLRVRTPPGVNHKRLARQLLRTHEAIPTSLRDMWFESALAQLQLGLENWAAARSHLNAFAATPSADARALSGLLRQLTDIWDVESVPQIGPELVAIVRSALLARPGGAVRLPAAAVRSITARSDFEAVVGKEEPQSIQWMRAGLQRAMSVGAVLDKATGQRRGTCFLVAARDVGLEGDAPIVLTVAYLVGGSHNTALKPSQAQVIFEASEHPARLHFAKLLWSSPSLDASLLELASPPPGLEALPLAGHLPVLTEPQRVYLVGHAGGKSLAFSFLDNELIDHEGPPDGHPSTPGVVRVHYRTPTEPGSAGSPVFNHDWQVVALHHLGGDIPRLNGKTGTYSAKEGIWIQSIAQARKQRS